jgi:hypothetical protein
MMAGGDGGGPTIFSDDFNRANEALSASSDWYQLTGGGDVVSNKAQGEAGAGSYLRWAFEIAGADGYAEIDVEDLGVGLILRSDPGRTVWYEAYWATDGNVYLSRLGATVIGGPVAGGSTGQTLRLEAEGTTIRVKQNGSTIISATDATYDGSSGNFPGIYLHSGNPDADNFEAGEL